MHVLSRRSYALYGSLLALLLLAFYDGTKAQSVASISVDQTQVVFDNVLNGGATTRTLNVSSSASANVAVGTANTASWLQITPAGSINVMQGTPAPLSLTVNAAA